MAGIPEFPIVVEGTLEQFLQVFTNKLERVRLAEYLTFSILAHHKDISAIKQ